MMTYDPYFMRNNRHLYSGDPAVFEYVNRVIEEQFSCPSSMPQRTLKPRKQAAHPPAPQPPHFTPPSTSSGRVGLGRGRGRPTKIAKTPDVIREEIVVTTSPASTSDANMIPQISIPEIPAIPIIPISSQSSSTSEVAVQFVEEQEEEAKTKDYTYL